MAKDAYYFSHDGNARNDENLLAVRMRHGAEGYGIFFMVLERLLESTDYMSVKDYNIIAFDFRVSAEKVKSVVEDYGLFTFTEDGKRFYSESFLCRMRPLDNIRRQRSNAGKNSAEKRAENKGNPTTVQRPLGKNPTKESKVKESKEEKSKKEKEKKKSYRFAPPDLAQVYDCMLKKNPDIDIAKIESQKFVDFYDSNNWMVGKNKMKKWESAVSGWINRMNNFKPNQNGNIGTGTRHPTINRQTADDLRQSADGWEVE